MTENGWELASPELDTDRSVDDAVARLMSVVQEWRGALTGIPWARQYVACVVYSRGREAVLDLLPETIKKLAATGAEFYIDYYQVPLS